MSAPARNARVISRSLPLWRLRLNREAWRYLLGLAAAFGLLASARYALYPPRAAIAARPAAETPPLDPAAESYAVEFARRYLTWSAAEPAASPLALESFTGAQMQPSAGLVLPSRGSEHVEWAEVAQRRQPAPGVHVYTIAAETSPAGPRDLAVTVERTAQGAISLDGYPAFVGAPASAPSPQPPQLATVADQALRVVVRRALTNYLADAPSELASDLVEGAVVTPPSYPLRLTAVTREDWALGGGTVLALVQATDGLGARYSLAYEVEVERAQGRWLVAAIETDPDA